MAYEYATPLLRVWRARVETMKDRHRLTYRFFHKTSGLRK